MQAIILAGGKGTRLKPFTTNFPKPLVPIDDVPILEVVLRQLKKAGFTEIVLAVNHLAELLIAFFGNGEKFGLKISYSIEDKILGTAGPVKLIKNLHDNFLIMNGDLLTTIDYKAFFDSHCRSNALATIATYRKEVKIDLGVLSIEGDRFKDYIEKPIYHFDVSMGIYGLNRRALEYIPSNDKFDMPQLILALHKAGKQIKCYTGDYFWLDIGRVDDYEVANDIFKKRRQEFLQ
jgi:NDP-sugar pyrophosphorylase family protein